MEIIRQFPSASSDATHTTKYDPETGAAVCSCQGWKFSKTTPKACRHTRLLAAEYGSTTPGPTRSTIRTVATPEGFVKPMLASPMPAKITIRPGESAAEPKIDGHRLIVEVTSHAMYEEIKYIKAWSRYGVARVLPSHIVEGFQSFPCGLYDGELYVPGGQSHNVTELTQSRALVYVVFDVLRLLDQQTTGATYDVRRSYLTEIFSRLQNQKTAVVLIESRLVHSMADVEAFRDEVWASQGEGLIVKRRAATYQPGKRSKDFLKIKKLQTAVLTVIGFEASKGTVLERGAYATVLLRDEHGVETSTKTLNDEELDRFSREAIPGQPHPAIGRRLVVEYQDKTEDGKYRHIRWDHWE